MAKFIKLTIVKEENGTKWFVYPKQKVLVNTSSIKICIPVNGGRMFEEGGAKCNVEIIGGNGFTQDYFVTESFEDIEKELIGKE